MFTQFFGNYLLKKGVIDADQLLTILQTCRMEIDEEVDDTCEEVLC